MSRPVTAVFRQAFVLCTMVPALAAAAQAATVDLSPPTVQNDVDTQLTLTITGLTAGQTVVVDRYLDVNGNGVDAADPLVQHFSLTDGEVPLIGGQRNLNVPGDDDGRMNNSIEARLFYPGVPDLDRFAGSYVYRVSNPSSHAVLGTGSLTVAQDTTLLQGVQGTLTAAGIPRPYALVALVANKLVSATVADANARRVVDFLDGPALPCQGRHGLV